MACPSCNDATPLKQIRSKICYVGHQQWLPIGHRMVNNKKIDGKVDRRPPPTKKDIQHILTQLENVVPKLPGKHEKYGGKKSKRHLTELNWTKNSIF